MPVLTDHLRSWLVRELRRSVVHERVKLASGAWSDWYVDCRKVLYGPDAPMVEAIAAREMGGVPFDAIGGVGYGGTPLGLGLARRWQVPSFAVRLEPKAHGRTGKVVGALEPGQSAVLVEDVFTTGSSVCTAVEAVRDYGAEIVRIICVLNRGNASLREVYGIPFSALVTADDLEDS